jgi:hypothetical protein
LKDVDGRRINGGSMVDQWRDEIGKRRLEKRRGAGEMWHKPLSGHPADDRLRVRILFPEAFQLALAPGRFEPRSRRRPSVEDPAVVSRPHHDLALSSLVRCNPAVRDLAPDVARLNTTSPTGSEPIAPRGSYFFFFAAALRFAGAFFFAAVFAFAFFTMLPS